jgi:hypothetical protein
LHFPVFVLNLVAYSKEKYSGTTQGTWIPNRVGNDSTPKRAWELTDKELKSENGVKSLKGVKSAKGEKV